MLELRATFQHASKHYLPQYVIFRQRQVVVMHNVHLHYNVADVFARDVKLKILVKHWRESFWLCGGLPGMQ